MITVGGCLAYCNRRVSPPRISTSSSLTILMTCWAGLSALLTSSPAARSLTAPMNWRTTGSATSASSSAIRISRATASMSAWDSRPLPRRPVKTECSRSDRVSNMREPLAREDVAFRLRDRRLQQAAAAVDVDDLAGDVAALLGGEEGRHVRDVVRHAAPPDRDGG